MAVKSIAPLAVQITRLEMTAPPKSSLAIPVNIQAAIMRAPKIPLTFYRYLYRQVGARWQWVDRLRMSDEELAAILHNERNDVSVLYVNGAPAGFFEHFRVDDDTIELSHFGLMEHALAVIGNRPSTLEAQAHLTGFYSRFGYEVAGAGYLEDGIPHVPMKRS